MDLLIERMRIKKLHDWDLLPAEAIALQREFASRVRLRKVKEAIATVAGADMAFCREGQSGVAVVIVFSYPDLIEMERHVVRGPVSIPYIPGLLSFRECPLLLSAFSRLTHLPDVAIFDGQGIAHPRGLGLASHMGLWLNLPTIGCAKSRLVGTCDEPEQKRGSFTPLMHVSEGKEKIIGACLRTRDGVKPLFISPGHLCDVSLSLQIILSCHEGFRLPKPTRSADRLAGKLARGELSLR